MVILVSITKPVLIEVSIPKPVGKRKQRKTFIWKVDTLQPDINLCSIFHFNFEHLSQNHQCTYTLIYRNPDVQIFQQILAISVRLQYLIKRILYLPKLFGQTGLSKQCSARSAATFVANDLALHCLLKPDYQNSG